MSFDALAWAGKCQPGSAARKLVLLALADRHNPESNVAYPSITWLAEWTGLNRKTIITALADLEALKMISDSGKRAGKTGQIKAYSLHIGTVPKTEQSQKRNSSIFSVKQSQKRDTEPVREPVIDKAKALPIARVKVLAEKPFDVSDAIWQDWLSHRKAKFTPTALEGFAREAAKAGWTIEAALTESLERGWQGFKADWVKDKTNGNSGRISNNTAGNGFRAALRQVQTGYIDEPWGNNSSRM